MVIRHQIAFHANSDVWGVCWKSAIVSVRVIILVHPVASATTINISATTILVSTTCTALDPTAPKTFTCFNHWSRHFNTQLDRATLFLEHPTLSIALKMLLLLSSSSSFSILSLLLCIFSSNISAGFFLNLDESVSPAEESLLFSHDAR
jgi:hypothetical protein